jgi:SAM-dependent methyltransferase
MDQNSASSVQLIDAPEELQGHQMPEQTSQCPLCSGQRIEHFMTATDRFHGRKVEYQLMRCPACLYIWLANPPKPEEMWFHYSEDYHRAIMAGGEGSALSRWQRQRDTVARYKNGGAILDIGCSSGAFLGTMKGGSWKLFGIDMEASTAEKAKAATGAEIFVGEALDAPFPDESFDVITGFDVLEHVYHPNAFLTKILQWLKPGGIVYLGLPNIDSWEARALGTFWYGLELPRHLSFFSPRSLRHAMTSLGFQELSLITPRTTYVEDSANYICSEIAEKMGMSPIPMAKRGPRSIPFRLVRKALRLSMVAPFAEIASLAGAGASMEAVFMKNMSPTNKPGGKA